MLSIRLFGNVRIHMDDRPVTITRRKSRALLYYIAAHPEPVSRRQLIALLWTDHNDQAARNNLRSTLYSLRQDLGDLLDASNDLLALDSAAMVDVRAFSSALGAPAMRTQTLAEALDLYRGDFLSDFSLPDTPEYDDWIAAEREAYRRMAIRGFAKLGRLHMEAEDYHAAVTAIQQALNLDPFQEDLQRESLYLHYLAGDRAGAIRRFAELREMLEDELGVPPMAETQALYDAIITDQLPTPQPAYLRSPKALIDSTPAHLSLQSLHLPEPQRQIGRSSRPEGELPFAGRMSELEQLRTSAGLGKLILVEGEPGIGKTRLINEYLRTLTHGEDKALLILTGKARELEDRLPYQPVIEALRNLQRYWNWNRLRQVLQLPDIWRDEVGRLVPELFEMGTGEVTRHAAAARQPNESRLWEGLFQLLAALAQQTQLYFFLDDLHWADVASLGMLGYLIRQSASTDAGIHFLATSRPLAQRSETAVLQESLRREDLLLRVPLQRLTKGEIAELAGKLSPNFSVPLSHWLLRGSEGNPFILEELVRYARQNRILAPNSAVDLAALPASPIVPQTVYTLIQSRLALLSEGARRMLDAAVALGREFEFEVVARASALSDIAALDALDELRQARLIHALDESRFAFDHSLTMEVAYREVGEPRHRLLHRRLAAALENIYQHQLDEVAGLIAQHYWEGNAPELASPYARRAGDRAFSLAAWKAAADFYRQALSHAADADRSAILVALARANLYAGDLSAAAQAARQAYERQEQLVSAAMDESRSESSPKQKTERADERDQDARSSTAFDVTIVADALSLLSEALLLQARYDEIMELAQKVDANQGPVCQQPAIQFVTHYMLGTALSTEGLHLDKAIEHLQAAAEQLRSHPNAASSERMAQVDFEMGNLEAQRGHLPEAIAYFQKLLTNTQDLQSDDGLRFHILAYNNLGYHLHLLDDPAALDYARRGLDLARDKGMLTLTPYLYSTLGEIALAQDDLATAETYFNFGLAEAKRFQIPERIAGLTANMGLLAARRSQTDRAVQHLQNALEIAEAAHARYLTAQIQIWLASLLPADKAAPFLIAAQAIVTSGNYGRLAQQLESIAQHTAGSTTTGQ